MGSCQGERKPCCIFDCPGKGRLAEHLLAVVPGHSLWILEPLMLPFSSYSILLSTCSQLLSPRSTTPSFLLHLLFMSHLCGKRNQREQKNTKEWFITRSETTFKQELILTTCPRGEEAYYYIWHPGRCLQRDAFLPGILARAKHGLPDSFIIGGPSLVCPFFISPPTELLWGRKLAPCVQWLELDRITW